MQNEKYSVFISFKRNALDGSGKTRDCELAEHLHKTLQANGIVTFFSEKDLFTSRFRRQIDDALDQAQILVVVGTTHENMEAEWVKYEWETFQNDIWEKLKPNGEIITYLEGMSPREAPRGLRTLQSFQSNELKELVKFIKKILGMDTDAEIIIPPYQSELEEEERHHKAQLKLEEEQRQREAKLKLEEEERQRQIRLELEEELRQRQAQLKLEEEQQRQREERLRRLRLEEDQRKREARQKLDAEQRQILKTEQHRHEEQQKQSIKSFWDKDKTAFVFVAAVIVMTLVVVGAITLPKLIGGNEDAISYDDKASSDDLSLHEYTIENGEVTITGLNNKKEVLIIPANIEGKPVTKIGEYAFFSCSSLKSITIPDSVTYIGNSAFDGCTSLTSITIPDSVTEIGYNAFENCYSLTSITIPDSVTYIGEYTFVSCTSLKSITIPDSVTSIRGNAFRHCISLKSIAIPDSVTEIGKNAFNNCTSLTSITISDSVAYIGEHAFIHCPNLTIYGKAGSVANIYAKRNNIHFVAQ